MLELQNWVILLAIYAYCVKNEQQKKRAWRIVAIFLLFISQSLPIYWLNQWWEKGIRKEKALNSYATAVVLGGMSAWDEDEKYLQFHSSSDRLWQAVKLYKQGKVNSVIISGGSGSVLYPEEREANYLKRYLEQSKIADSNFYYENKSRNTHENALYCRQIIDSLKLKQPILLVTSAFHQRRAMACFKKVDLNVVPYASDRTGTIKNYGLENLLPSVEAIQLWNRLIREWVGMLSYKIKGYI